MGVGVGSKALKQAADQLGFQQKTGIEIGWEESVGLVGMKTLHAAGWTDPGTSPWIPEDMASASMVSPWCDHPLPAGPRLCGVREWRLVGNAASRRR